ncbi:MAG: hypothetical protein WCG06_02815, partial [Candidatus Omnitrophota bacterium]
GAALEGFDVALATNRSLPEASGRTGELLWNGRFIVAADAQGNEFSLDVKGIGPYDGTFAPADRTIFTGLVQGEPIQRKTQVLVGYRRKTEFDGNDRLAELEREPAATVSGYPIPAFTVKFDLDGTPLMIEARLSPGNRRMGQFWWNTSIGEAGEIQTAGAVGGAVAFMLLQEKPSVHLSINLENLYYPLSPFMAAYANPEKSLPLFDQRRAFEVLDAGVSMAEGRVAYAWRNYAERHDELLTAFWTNFVEVFAASGVLSSRECDHLRQLAKRFSPKSRNEIISVIWSKYMAAKLVENRQDYGYSVGNFVSPNRSSEALLSPLHHPSDWVVSEISTLNTALNSAVEANNLHLILMVAAQIGLLEAKVARLEGREAYLKALTSLRQRTESAPEEREQAGARLATTRFVDPATLDLGRLRFSTAHKFPLEIVTSIAEIEAMGDLLYLIAASNKGIIPIGTTETKFAAINVLPAPRGARLCQLVDPRVIDSNGNAQIFASLQVTREQMIEAQHRYTARSLETSVLEQENGEAERAHRDCQAQDSITRILFTQLVKGLKADKYVLLSIAGARMAVPELIHDIRDLQSELRGLRELSSNHLNVFFELVDANGARLATVEGFQSDTLPANLAGKSIERLYTGALSDTLVNQAKANKAGLLAVQEARIDEKTVNVIPYKPNMRAGIMTAIADAQDEKVQRALRTLTRAQIGTEEVRLIKEVPGYATAQTYRQKNLIVKALAVLSEKLYQAYLSLRTTAISA